MSIAVRKRALSPVRLVLEVPNSDRIPPEMEGSISTKPKHLSATETSTGAPFLPCAPVSEQKKQTRGGPGYGQALAQMIIRLIICSRAYVLQSSLGRTSHVGGAS